MKPTLIRSPSVVTPTGYSPSGHRAKYWIRMSPATNCRRKPMPSAQSRAVVAGGSRMRGYSWSDRPVSYRARSTLFGRRPEQFVQAGGGALAEHPARFHPHALGAQSLHLFVVTLA